MKRWAIVTGGLSEIGKEISISLAKKGYSLILQYHSKHDIDIEKIKDEVKEYDVEIIFWKIDFSEKNEIDKFVQNIKDLNVKIDLLIFNAGIHEKFIPGDEFEKFRYVYSVNVFAPIFILKSIGELLVPTRQTLVIFISSPNIEFNNKLGNIYYSTSKSTYQTLSLTIAKEYKPVRSVVIVPGYLDTNFFRTGKNDSEIELFKQKSLSGELTTILDVVKAVDFLISNTSFNAEILKINSGYGKQI